MRKKILFGFLALLIGIGALGIFSVSNLRWIDNTLITLTSVDLKFYEEILKIDEEISTLNELVASSSIYQREELLKENQSSIDEITKKVALQLDGLDSEKYNDIHKLKFQQDEEKFITISELIKDLRSSLGNMIPALKNFQESIQNKNNLESKLKENYNDLSKNFRKIDFSQHLVGDDARKAKKKYSELARSVMVVMFSNSVRDLNFAGRSKFESATKYWDKLLADDKQYLKFKSLFEETFARKINKGASTSSDIYIKYRQESYKFIEILKFAKATSREMYSSKQNSISENLHDTFYVSVIISILIIMGGIISSIVVIRSLSSTLLSISKTLTSNAEKVTNLSKDVSDIGFNLEQNSIMQTESLTETSSAMEEISSMVKNNEAQATQSLEKTNEMENLVGDATGIMNDMQKSMEDIADSNKDINRLVEVIDGVGSKTEVINDISFQTKILSFNASVEAERAGEYGRGFSVVAQEVSVLAKNSAKAAQEISKIVGDSIKEAKEITRINEQKVQAALDILNKSLKILASIQDQAKTVRSFAGQIASASREQSLGVEQVNVALNQLDNSNQLINTYAKDNSSQSVVLKDCSKSLTEYIEILNRFIGAKEDDGGAANFAKNEKHNEEQIETFSDLAA